MDDLIGKTGLQFFGAMTASISHEIKNRMAIINEQAGLLADFIHMAQKGKPLDSQRLERLAAAVKSQVSLADGIIKNMNQFAHTVDHFQKSVDLGELLLLMAELFKRRTGHCGIGLEVKPPQLSLMVETSPFLLMNLIWLCLLPLLDEKQCDQQLIFDCKKHGGKFIIGMTLGAKDGARGFDLSEAAKAMADALKANLVLESDTMMLRIELPGKAFDPAAV